MYAYIHAYIHTYVRTYVHTYIHTLGSKTPVQSIKHFPLSLSEQDHIPAFAQQWQTVCRSQHRCDEGRGQRVSGFQEGRIEQGSKETR